MNGAQEVARCFIVARCNGTVLLEPGKEILDQVPRFVQVTIMAALVPARFETGSHHCLTRFAAARSPAPVRHKPCQR